MLQNEHKWAKRVAGVITASTAYDANGNIKQMQQWGLKLNSSAQVDNLGYQYIAGSNKLLSVTEATLGTTDNKLGDFTDKNTSNDDYSYDANGNLTLDKNKSISSITYNNLNLPSVITVTGKGTITYTYDAAGNKLRKTTVENNVSIAPYTGITVTSTTDYTGGFIYESKQYDNTTVNTNLGYLNKLQFTGHEEGRIRPAYTEGTTADAYVLNGFVYDYMIKDHLGNVRMVLTEEVKEDIYPVLSFEGTSGTQEVNDQNDIWENAGGNAIDVIGRRTVSPGTLQGSGMTPAPGTQSLLVRSSTGKIGAGKLLKVMSGDKIHTTVQYYYSTNTGNGSTNGLASLTSVLATMLGNSAGALPVIKDGASTVTGALGVNTVAQSFFNSQSSGSNNGRPKAFLNVLFFDEQFKFEPTASYSEQIGSSSYGQILIALGSARQAAKNGYCYVYISNESDDMVYFDNLTLTHERGAMLEETHYYPFGLTMAGISSKAAGGIENKKKYNGYELNTDLDINLDESFYRLHDPQIGRFWQIDPKPNILESPYVAMGDNPIGFCDPLGDIIVAATDEDKADILAANEVAFGKGNFRFNKDNQLEFTGKLKNFKGDVKKALKSYLKEIVNNKDKIQVVGLNDKFDEGQKQAMENHGGGITVINPVGEDGKQIISTAIEKDIANATQIPLVTKKYTYIDNDGKVQNTNEKPADGTYKGTVYESYANKVKDGKYATVPTNVTTTYFHEIGHGMYPNDGKAVIQFDNQIRAIQNIPLRSVEDSDHK